MAITIRDSSAGSSPRPFFSSTFGEPEQLLHPPKLNMWQRLGSFGRWLHRDDHSRSSSPADQRNVSKPGPLSRRLSRKVGVGLPRPPTFRRQNSERRERLAPVEPEPRRAVSADRRPTLSVQRTRSPPPAAIGRLSAPEVQSWRDDLSAPDDDVADADLRDSVNLSRVESAPYQNEVDAHGQDLEGPLDLELERKWILNLSMHFRDKSEREKFFVTYAETPNRWRRVTVSCDYRGATPDSLEQDLKELQYQRDKSARIYESIRESLPQIQFYDTVTNLKLETSDGRLHVHVTEDVNEIIPYPPTSSVRHLDARLIPENSLRFDAHLSGFVYKVQLDGKAYIKKEIPGPDTVDEFLYEINALHALSGSRSVVQFEGIIMDERGERVKGLLISYAEQGALVDVLYDYQGQLPLARRERWAKQIVQGLCEIHEAGYVQGDFTLSNIVIDGNDDAKIIDINRRGCPVGWEPPEIASKIESNQRISMYIGVKSDVFQLGMTLWALAMQEDEPERQTRPLRVPADAKIPDYYATVIHLCLSDRPQDRLSAKEMLALFPALLPEPPVSGLLPPRNAHGPPSTDPPFYDAIPISFPHAQSVCLDGDHEEQHPNVVYVTPAEYRNDDELDYPPRGRQPSTHALQLSDYQPSNYLPSSASPQPDGRRSISQSDFETQMASPDLRLEPRFEEVEIDGTQYLVNPDVFPSEEFQALRDNTHDPHHSQDLGSAHSSGLSRVVVPSTGEAGKENDIDLESSLDLHYHDTKSGNGDEANGFENEAFLGDLAGVGGHPSCSLEQKTRSEEDSAASGILSEPALTATETRTVPDHKEPTLSETPIIDFDPPNEVSLLSSQLPINPAQTARKPVHRRGSTSRTASLVESILPINPAQSFDSS
jgi:serine/threonine protein kinase